MSIDSGKENKDIIDVEVISDHSTFTQDKTENNNGNNISEYEDQKQYDENQKRIFNQNGFSKMNYVTFFKRQNLLTLIILFPFFVLLGFIFMFVFIMTVLLVLPKIIINIFRNKPKA
jgi:hypothetical protein